MSEMKKDFDIINNPLEGSNLIEASAGTGKTYTISGLFLRLILEKKLSVDQILVVTFTEAATAELKDRILNLLRKACTAFSTQDSDDRFLRALVKKYPDHETARSLLNDAVRSFDQAAIFTIHGFCLRILQENAFESGSLFDTELMVNQNEIYQEIAEDFWRSNFYNASSCFINFILNRNIGPDTLWPPFARYIPIPNIKILPKVEIPDSADVENRFQTAFSGVISTWREFRSEISEILMKDRRLSRNKYRDSTIATLIAKMDDMAQSSGSDPDLFSEFEKLTTESIRNAVKKNSDPPSHLFFNLCDELQQVRLELEEINFKRLLALKIDLFETLRHESFRRSRQRNIRTFNDLLLDCYRALENEDHSANLVASVRKKYAAALIDEFQDTDPVQYTIFQKIFGANQDSILFLIGDPKQAIYSFRGADIFAYMNAAAGIDSCYTLRRNWRSETGLVSAVNTVFGNIPAPFVFDEIQYNTVRAAEENEQIRPLTLDGKPSSAIRIWYLESKDDKEISKNTAYETIPGAFAGEISRILSAGGKGIAFLGDQPVRAGDIAVLVRKNREAALIQKALSALKIPSVIHSSGNIFDSFEALEMERVLGGIANPGSERMVKSALTTQLFGLNAADLADLMADDHDLEMQFSNFRKYHTLWEKKGFIQMFSIFCRDEKVQERLMSYPDGERRYTNIRHLSEILHQASTVGKRGISELLSWFRKQRDPNQERLDEHQLRLESDENAVRVVTVHKSKGLEYPIVFCPFTWETSKLKENDDLISFHDDQDAMALTLDVGSKNSESIQKAEREILSENLRLLYVAVTRAKNLCYLAWGRFRGAESSAPGVLFHPGSKNRMDKDGSMLSDLSRLMERRDSGIQVEKMPEEAGRPFIAETAETILLECRKFRSKISGGWRFSSFSSLIRNDSGDDPPADDELDAEKGAFNLSESEDSEVTDRFDDIFLFPKGINPGICLHDMMEHLDFEDQNPATIQKCVSEKLVCYGFDLKWTSVVSGMIRNILNAPLDCNRSGFQLSRIQKKDRITEFEFCFPTQSVTPEKLKNILLEHADSSGSRLFAERIGRLDFGVLSGFMKGFIDLVFRYEDVFFLLDWKSNYLGKRREDYGFDALAETMEKDLYILQAYLYTVALNQYLSKRFPGYTYAEHFGGFYYVFMRAFGSPVEDRSGIYMNRPSPELIESLSNLLIHFGKGKSG